MTEVRSLSQQLYGLEANFNEIASGAELRELLGPLINGLKQLTSRPREINRLHTDIITLQQRLGSLDTTQQELQSRHQQIKTQIAITKQRLDRRRSEKKTISEAIGQLLQVLFRSRGRNLVFAILIISIFGF